ncbi:MAG TPA: MarR family transcriptional regulator [Gemmatimonadaceae bacterium]
MRARAQDTAFADALADRWHSLAVHLLRAVRREDVKAGLTGPRLSALSVVVFTGPLTLSELAAAEQVKPPTMTRLVQALEREGLVRRVGDPDDRRIVRVRATPRGQAVLAQGRARRVARLATPMAHLDPTEQDTLRRAADIIGRVVASLP